MEREQVISGDLKIQLTGTRLFNSEDTAEGLIRVERPGPVIDPRLHSKEKGPSTYTPRGVADVHSITNSGTSGAAHGCNVLHEILRSDILLHINGIGSIVDRRAYRSGRGGTSKIETG